jgi:hypothetical protein
MSKDDETITGSKMVMYQQGFKDGWEAAVKFYENKNPKPLGPAQTMDIQWPDRPTSEGWGITYTNSCRVCHIPSGKLTNYVCYYPNCPSKVTS